MRWLASGTVRHSTRPAQAVALGGADHQIFSAPIVIAFATASARLDAPSA